MSNLRTMQPPLPIYLILSTLIMFSNAEYLYGLRWTLWAYTNGDSNDIKYIFPGGVNEVYTFNPIATSINFWTESYSSSSNSYTLADDSVCWPSSAGFKIDELLSCIGNLDGKGWAGLFYKSDSGDWDHATQDYWIKVITATLEERSVETPSLTAYYIPTLAWTQFASTSGSCCMQYVFGIDQLFTFDPEATAVTFKNVNEGKSYTLYSTDGCFPAQNFKIDDVLLCVSIEVASSEGWGGIYYKHGNYDNNDDWYYWTTTFLIQVVAPIPSPTSVPTTSAPSFLSENPTINPTLFPSKSPTKGPATYNPTSHPFVNPTKIPTANPIPSITSHMINDGKVIEFTHATHYAVNSSENVQKHLKENSIDIQFMLLCILALIGAVICVILCTVYVLYLRRKIMKILTRQITNNLENEDTDGRVPGAAPDDFVVDNSIVKQDGNGEERNDRLMDARNDEYMAIQKVALDEAEGDRVTDSGEVGAAKNRNSQDVKKSVDYVNVNVDEIVVGDDETDIGVGR